MEPGAFVCVEVKVTSFVPCWCVASVIVVCHIAVYLATGAFRWGTGL